MTCWNCGEHGHIRRNCSRPRREGRPEGTQRNYRAITATKNSSLVIEGLIEDRPTTMLIDSGSAVTILRADVWKAASTKSSNQLDPPGSPVVVANGEDLSVLGRAYSLSTSGWREG